ncbi:hypothetical protein RF11_15207 [Thelohanellus kitauei]|uniref:DNA-directed RNA polymerase III subunit RPC3 n=1 Tax=Thelohanellus kitauei TaxID=669202 RepID=A0A0C2JTG5_THEKT|nr:hypothetical protein RF11_15207 [Thelohanellus kitauei]
MSEIEWMTALQIVKENFGEIFQAICKILQPLLGTNLKQITNQLSDSYDVNQILKALITLQKYGIVFKYPPRQNKPRFGFKIKDTLFHIYRTNTIAAIHDRYGSVFSKVLGILIQNGVMNLRELIGEILLDTQDEGDANELIKALKKFIEWRVLAQVHPGDEKTNGFCLKPIPPNIIDRNVQFFLDENCIEKRKYEYVFK